MVVRIVITAIAVGLLYIALWLVCGVDRLPAYGQTAYGRVACAIKAQNDCDVITLLVQEMPDVQVLRDDRPAGNCVITVTGKVYDLLVVSRAASLYSGSNCSLPSNK